MFCESLTSIEIPFGVTAIEYDVFSGCSKLRGIKIPASVTEIDDSAFENCGEKPNDVIIYGCAGTAAEQYAKEKEMGFVQIGNISDCAAVLAAEKYTYNGSAKYPSATVKCNGTVLKKGIDYTLTYSNNKNVGTGTVTITGIGKYSGIKMLTFSIDLPFTDVKKGTWQYNTAAYAYMNGIIKGMNETTFAPNVNMTRGQFVTILYRLEGSPYVSSKISYPDVSPDAYYAAAVAWAKQNGLVSGYGDGMFKPGGNISRQEIAIFLQRYALFKGQSTAVISNASYQKCSDYKKVSSYAVEAVNWAYEQGLVGSGDVLNPQKNASRIEVAAMLQRYLEK